MKRALIVLATVAMIGSAIVPDPAHAGGRGVAAGVVGGLAVGALLGAAIASPRPGPVYVEEPVYYHRRPRPAATGPAASRNGTAIAVSGAAHACRSATEL